jgi:hypothetical protein
MTPNEDNLGNRAVYWKRLVTRTERERDAARDALAQALEQIAVLQGAVAASRVSLTNIVDQETPRVSERATKGARTVTSRIPWPRDAQAARDESAEHANAIMAILERTYDTNAPMTEGELWRSVGRAINHAHKIARFLEREGAQTIPTR